MWTITFTRNSKEYTASFTSEFQTDSPSLEAMYLIKLANPPILQATATGPSAELDLTVPHLVYAYVAGILFNDLDVKDWNTEGDYLWPLDETPASTVFKYVDYLRTELHLKGQHDQASHGNRGGGVNQELSEEERTFRKAIETEILAERAAKGMKPLSPASLKVYVINEAGKRKKEGAPEQAKVKVKGIPATSGIDQLLGKGMEMSIPKPIREPVMMAMVEIEKLHNIPEDSIPVSVKTTTAKGAHGSFYFSGGPMNERPSKIVIKPAALQNNAHPALTFAHEFAHYLDSQAGLGILAVSTNNPQAH